MANHMEEVAGILGLNIGEEFRLSVNGKILDAKYVLTRDGCEVMLDDRTEWEESMWLTQILTGGAEIVKKPWKPMEGEKYWFVGIKGLVVSHYNPFCCADVIRCKVGNCYRTKAEAEANVDRWEAWFTSDERVYVFNG